MSLKPNRKDISLETLLPKDIEFFCKTQHIDKIRVKRLGNQWNQDIADQMEKPYPFYFVAKKNLQYDVLSGLIFEPWISDHAVLEMPKSDAARKCIEHFIKSLK